VSNVLIIGDTHCPCMLPGYITFLRATYRKWKCNRVVHIGDIVDNCALSFHTKKPQQKNPLGEYSQAMKQIRKLVKAFPKADLMLGNHDVLPYRWAQEVGIPEEMLRKFGEIFLLPKGWNVHYRYGQIVIDGVIYQHGDRGKGGQRIAAFNNAKAEFNSVVQGHHHAQAGVEFCANLRNRVFGMQVGCGVDWEHHQQEYGVKYSGKPMIGCGIVLGGKTPIFEPMLL